MWGGSIYTYHLSFNTWFRPVILTLLSVLMLSSGVFAITPDEFPPVQGPYNGDYILITEPGRYTLEHNISHQYPVGIIIMSSSVILDGQGYTVRPGTTASTPTVGIWVSLTDRSGKLISGVSIQNLTLADETFGLYAEGSDSTDVPWGRIRSGDASSTVLSLPQNLALSDLRVLGCDKGIVLTNQSGARLSRISVSGSAGSGITSQSGQIKLSGSSVIGNGGFGIDLSGSSDSEITDSTVDQNTNGVIHLVQVNGIRLVNITHGDGQAIVYGPDSTGVSIVPSEKKDGTIPENSAGDIFHLNPDSPFIIPAEGQKQNKTDPLIFITPSPEPVSTPAGEINEGPSTTPTSTPALVSPPLSIMSGIHATIIGDTIPSEMHTGRAYPVGLQMYNDGSEDWIEQYQVGIMALDETTKYGPGWLPVTGGPVKSGQSQTIQFSLTSPAKPGSYTLKYQAAREGSGVQILFGRAYTKAVIVT